MRDMMERYILELIRRSTPDQTAWNIEKIRQGVKTNWNYIDGCMLMALMAMTDISGDDRYAAFVEQVAERESSVATDDTELVAVIAAAVAMDTGLPADGFVVRSIRRR